MRSLRASAIALSKDSDASRWPMSVERARAIAAAVGDAGGRALVVGGWVRDRLIGRHSTPGYGSGLARSVVEGASPSLGEGSKDMDIEVYALPADRVRVVLQSFGRVETVGESFQVYKVGDIDVSLPRRESKSGRGH